MLPLILAIVGMVLVVLAEHTWHLVAGGVLLIYAVCVFVSGLPWQ